jgi:hypothetical protein
MAAMNPRVQRDELKSFVGKKVMIGTRSYHYISGQLQALEEAESRLVVSVAGKPVKVPLDQVATIQEAPAAQAEYVK